MLKMEYPSKSFGNLLKKLKEATYCLNLDFPERKVLESKKSDEEIRNWKHKHAAVHSDTSLKT